jgi:hypothetical protein
MIAWMDIVTRRVWIDILLIEGRGGVRGLDVARSFFAMCCEWGIPSRVYTDNGGEYNFVEYLQDFLALRAS